MFLGSHRYLSTLNSLRRLSSKVSQTGSTNIRKAAKTSHKKVDSSSPTLDQRMKLEAIRADPKTKLYKSSASATNITPIAVQRDKKSSEERTEIFNKLEPVEVQPETGRYENVGEEISGKKLDKAAMILKLNELYQLPSIKELARSHHINDKLFTKAFISFRKYCFKSTSLPPELHIKLCDIIDKHGHVTDLFPFFLSHAREVFPHLECQEELRKISDLGLPHSWYPEARSKIRKIIFHAGPTNSGKTYHAMKRFMEAKSAIYCGPLKLLAVEIFQKANANNVPCDLVTGEQRKYVNPDGETRSSHVSLTVEMSPVNESVEVVVIDEIQMLRDPSRGWAWTRALLGIPADEVHLCGEEAALDLVRKMLMPTGDVLEVIRYKRLTPLQIEDQCLGDLKNVRSGDCIVCFNKESLYQVSMALEKLDHQVAVVYGTLPPGAKLAQCKKFNQLEDCKVMVATDAIGMGLNLSIGRIIFYSLLKTTNDESGKKWMEYLSTSQCLQIAGRAGRYNTPHDTGYVTTYKQVDLPQLKLIMSKRVEPIERAGLHPTAEQIELFAFQLPHLSLSNLIDLFIDLCEYDSSAFFICDLKNFRLLADSIEHIQIPLRSRYAFCCAPVNTNMPFSMAMFTKFVRQFSNGDPVTANWMLKNIDSKRLKQPKNMEELSYLEAVFDVMELYLWLSYRFPDIFPEPEAVRNMQIELDMLIYNGVSDIVGLLNAVKTRQRIIEGNLRRERIVEEIK